MTKSILLLLLVATTSAYGNVVVRVKKMDSVSRAEELKRKTVSYSEDPGLIKNCLTKLESANREYKSNCEQMGGEHKAAGQVRFSPFSNPFVLCEFSCFEKSLTLGNCKALLMEGFSRDGVATKFYYVLSPDGYQTPFEITSSIELTEAVKSNATLNAVCFQ